MARNFSEFINRVAYRGECFTLTRGGRPVGELRPAVIARRLSELPAILESLPHLNREDAEAFAADLESARRELDSQPIEDRWAS
jgi:antitoxin (DNA-binding transcriptional repressor) of toxin-antitoxin stability system